MDLPLQEIKKVLEYDDLEKIIDFLAQAEKRLTKILFSFEDLAGIYTENETTRLFAVCIHYVNTDGLKVLPKGKYLCANCTEENRKQTLRELIHIAPTKYGVEPTFTVQLIVVSGILQ